MSAPTLWMDTPDGDCVEVALPCHWAICRPCRGDGTRALGGVAITADEFAEWDEDDRETYRRGGYDTPCEECGGTGKVQVVDEDQLDPATLGAWHRQQADEAECRAIEAMERRMGA